MQMKVLLFAGYDTTSSKHRPLPICFRFDTAFSQPDRMYTVAFLSCFLLRTQMHLSAVGTH